VSTEWERQMAEDPWVRATAEFAPRAQQLLGLSPHSHPEDLLNAFEVQERIAVEAEQRLESTRFTTTSDNGLISVTMTGKAQVVSLVVDDEAFVRYRPDELGPAILETLNLATAHCGELVRESLAGLFGPDDARLDSIMESWPVHRVDDEDDDERLADWT
jgi:DNA-binding protein YbaB